MNGTRSKAALRRAALLVTASLLAAPALAADLGGTWILTMDGKSPSGEKEATVTFASPAADGGITVTMSGKKGAVESSGTLAGDEISWLYASPKKGVEATYEGRVQGSLMGGTVAINGKQGKPVRWHARRVDEGHFDLAGTWTFFIKGEARDYANLTKMTFGQDGPDLLVTLRSNDLEVECRGALDGGDLSFDYVRTTRDGGEYTARMTGSASGALMNGEADLGEYGKTTWSATLDSE